MNFTRLSDIIQPNKLNEDILFLDEALHSFYSGKILNKDKYKILTDSLNELIKTNKQMTVSEICLGLSKIFRIMEDAHLKISHWKNSTCGSLKNIMNHSSDTTKMYRIDKHKDGVWFKFNRLSGSLREMESIDNLLRTEVLDSIKIKKIVIDLRGINGGDLILAQKISSLIHGVPLAIGTYYQYYEHPSIEWGKILNKDSITAILALRYSEESIPIDHLSKKVQTQVSEIFNHDNYFNLSDEELKQFNKNGLIKKEYPLKSSYLGDIDKKIFHFFILVDKGCKSACEYILEATEKVSNVIVIGESTGGAIQFGSPGLIILKNTGLYAFIPTTYVKYEDNRKPDYKGYKPDQVINLLQSEEEIRKEVLDFVAKSGKKAP